MVEQRGVYDVLIPLNIQIQYIIHAVVYRLKCLVSITVLKGIELLVNLYTLYGVTYHSSNLKNRRFSILVYFTQLSTFFGYVIQFCELN